MTERVYRVLCPFGGSGGGALGFLKAEARLLGAIARFECMGSIDFDRVACDDFERFTGSRALCADIESLTVDELLAFTGIVSPDVVFMSPPCKGSSRLLSAEKAKTEKYQRMNRLALAWTRLMLEAWGDAPPRLLLLENVPGLPTRAGGMLRELKSLLRAHGYKFSAGFHCCGEIGGLAQRRKRFLLVARHAKRCPPTLYEPPKRRVRAIGEVLGKLPIPTSPAAAQWGVLHTMPRLSWRNWKRLALIPAGGDWRDLEGILAGRARREVFRRHPVADWSTPSDAITGPGGHAVEAVADPRTQTEEDVLRVRGANGGVYGVHGWEDTAGTVTGGSDNPSRGAFSVADPRATDPDFVPRGAYDAGWGVLGWNDTARTIAGQGAPGQGAYAVADGRSPAPEVRRMTLDEALALDLDPSKPPPFIPMIVAEDGTWHRPLTLLELAVLQSYPTYIDGAPIYFGGTRNVIAEHIGNSVPPDAARPIGEQMLTVLLHADASSWALSSGGGAVWVSPVSDRSDTLGAA